MTVYVDDFELLANVRGRYDRWSHLIADSPAELRAFAKKLGLSPCWIQKPGTEREHFDVTHGMRMKAISLGAEKISYFDLHEVSMRIAAKSGRFARTVQLA